MHQPGAPNNQEHIACVQAAAPDDVAIVPTRNGSLKDVPTASAAVEVNGVEQPAAGAAPSGALEALPRALAGAAAGRVARVARVAGG